MVATQEQINAVIKGQIDADQEMLDSHYKAKKAIPAVEKKLETYIQKNILENPALAKIKEWEEIPEDATAQEVALLEAFLSCTPEKAKMALKADIAEELNIYLAPLEAEDGDRLAEIDLELEQLQNPVFEMDQQIDQLNQVVEQTAVLAETPFLSRTLQIEHGVDNSDWTVVVVFLKVDQEAKKIDLAESFDNVEIEVSGYIAASSDRGLMTEFNRQALPHTAEIKPLVFTAKHEPGVQQIYIQSGHAIVMDEDNSRVIPLNYSFQLRTEAEKKEIWLKEMMKNNNTITFKA